MGFRPSCAAGAIKRADMPLFPEAGSRSGKRMEQLSTNTDQLEGMRHIAGGAFTMGSERFYPEESPVRRVRVRDLWIDETPVTNRQFAAFVDATGYRTVAEIVPDPRDYPGLTAETARAG